MNSASTRVNLKQVGTLADSEMGDAKKYEIYAFER